MLNTQGFWSSKLVQLDFVNHMSNPIKFYCSFSFARQYRQIELFT